MNDKSPFLVVVTLRVWYSPATSAVAAVRNLLQDNISDSDNRQHIKVVSVELKTP